ncbi:Rv3235 family protein [Curtobacterium sp. MCSS17_015]|uniref:Rv3235 family protein n=1 Tax=Curtobacterium sp. MCSS17_015 TaxID=2175666 RepID=UPI000DA97625|nr:Rv3235 family protein [Curtobacterium sp. MCSS17_015]WIB25299.1 Rv3235 family protein [Curtobacterium sp. MCSS17_015]
MTDIAERIDDEPIGRRGHVKRPEHDHSQSHDQVGDRRTADGTADATGAPPADAAADLPDAGETARSLALCVAEILTGAREVDTISRWISDEVHRHLQHRAAIAARARSVSRHSHHRAVIRVGGVVLDGPRDGVAEAAVVVHTRSRARAVAIRLEVRNGRWRATAIGVL